MSTSPVLENFDIMAILAMDRARLMREGEEIPPELEAGFEQLGKLDRDWVWVVESGGKIVGVLLACDCHGVAMIWRVAVLPGQSTMAVGRLLRRFLGDVRARGMVGYLTLVDASKSTQGRLQAIIEKAGGQKFGEFTLMASAMPRENI